MAHISCHYCGDMVNTDSDHALQEVVGWVNRGRTRGVNQIRGEDPTGRWCHKSCLPHTKDYIDRRQMGLL